MNESPHDIEMGNPWTNGEKRNTEDIFLRYRVGWSTDIKVLRHCMKQCLRILLPHSFQ